MKIYRDKCKSKIYHYTLPENLNKILKEGFKAKLPPVFGVADGYEKTTKFTPETKLGGKGVLYFTTDTKRWKKARVYVGKGKGTKDYTYYDYDNQKWVKEKKAVKVVHLKPIKAVIKSEAKVLTIDSLDSFEKFVGTTNGFFNGDLDDIIKTAKTRGYDVVNLKYKPGAWKYDEEDMYERLSLTGGADDYFILNKDILETEPPTKKEKHL